MQGLGPVVPGASCSVLPGQPSVGTWFAPPIPAAFVQGNTLGNVGAMVVAGPGDLYFVDTFLLQVVQFTLSSGFTMLSTTGSRPNAPVGVQPAVGIVGGSLYLYYPADPGASFAAAAFALDLSALTWSTLPTTNLPALATLAADPGPYFLPHVLPWGSQVAFISTGGAPGGGDAVGLYDPTNKTWSSVAAPAQYACDNPASGSDAVFCFEGASLSAFVITGAPLPAVTSGPSPGVQAVGAFVGTSIVAWDQSSALLLNGPTAASWTTITPPAAVSRAFPRVVAVDGKALIWGGDKNGFAQYSGMLYDPVATTWSQVCASQAQTSDANGETSIAASDGTNVYVLAADGTLYVVAGL
jgi:hypothetical protein